MSTAAWRQLQPLRYSDACPCCHDILGIAHCDLLDSDARHSGLCVSSSLSEATAWNSATFGTRMHAPAATTSSAQYLTTRSTRMHAPATSAALAAGHQLQSPRHSGVCLCGHDTLSVAPTSHLTWTHAPADTVSTAAWRQLRSLRYPDARPCSHYILGIAPCNPLDSERRPQLPLRLRQRSNSSVLCDTLHSDACPSGQYILLSASQPTLLEECLARTRFGYWSDDRRTSFSNLRQSGQGPQSDGG